MFSYDSGYDTDDTDELLASKIAAPIPVVQTASRSARTCSSKVDAVSGSLIVTDDWLFSLDSTRAQGAFDACAHVITHCARNSFF